MDICIGLITRRKIIKKGLKSHEVFHVEGVEVGTIYRSYGKEYFIPATGNKHDKIELLLKDDNPTDNYVALRVDHAGISFDFNQLQKTMLANGGEFYIKSKNGTELVSDINLIKIFKDEFEIKEKEFEEINLSSSSSISKMYNSIKETIIAQDEQIMRILTSIYKNQLVINSKYDMDLISKLKENILISGPTGTGKTEILKRISKLYNTPIVIEDVTTLSETGYKGRDIAEILENLYNASGRDIEIAQKSILVLDEFDKLAEKNNDGQEHVSKSGVQRSLLKLLDGSELYFNGKKFNTSKLTIVALGAFTGITDNEKYSELSSDDFVNFGMMRELIGRFSKYIAMNPLRKEDMLEILEKSNFSPLNTYKKLFKLLNVKFSCNEDFNSWIVERAILLNNGARSLKTVFDDCISGALFKIFAGEYSKIELIKPQTESNVPYILKQR